MELACCLGTYLPIRHKFFADVRTYWSAKSIERATGWKPDGILKMALFT